MFTASYALILHKTGERQEEESIQSVSRGLSADEAAYRIALCGGQEIGVFSRDGELLFLLVNVRSETLPAVDRALLSGGIPVYSEEELCAVIADYTG